jgi:hypothetical protein
VGPTSRFPIPMPELNIDPSGLIGQRINAEPFRSPLGPGSKSKFPRLGPAVPSNRRFDEPAAKSRPNLKHE